LKVSSANLIPEVLAVVHRNRTMENAISKPARNRFIESSDGWFVAKSERWDRHRMRTPQVYNVAVDFDVIAAELSTHRAPRDAANADPASRNIVPAQLKTIDDAADLLLDNDGYYRQLLLDLKAGGGPTTPATVSCKTKIMPGH
jgi:hypothetical protein